MPPKYKSVNTMQMCPSWPKEHDWKSCKRRTPFQGFKSLHLRQKKSRYRLVKRKIGALFFCISICIADLQKYYTAVFGVFW